MAEECEFSDKLKLDENELLSMLAVAQDGDSVAGTFGGKINRGKQIFKSLLRELKTGICGWYNTSPSVADKEIDLACSLLGMCISKYDIPKATAIPFVALMLKYKLEKICCN